MDVCELEKHPAVDILRPSSAPAEKNNNASTTTDHPRKREVSSRYKSPTPSKTCASRRSPSPSLTRSLPTTSQVACRRAQSVERIRPSTPSSPSSPSTPVKDSHVNMQLSTRRLSNGSRLQEGLWPSTMRSLNVSFQSDTLSIPISKKEKLARNIFTDQTLRPSFNGAHKQVELPSGSRKLTPERKRSSLKGKNVQDQSENDKPVDGLHNRLIDQHRWPGKIGGKLSSSPVNRSEDFIDKSARTLSTSNGTGLSSLRRTPTLLSIVKPLQKSSSNAAQLSSLEDIGRIGPGMNSDDDRVSVAHQVNSASLLEKLLLMTPAVKYQSIPPAKLRTASPSRTSISRGVSPARTRPSTPPLRGVSPSRIRASSVSSQSNSSTSVLSFVADFRKGKKGTNYIEDAHQIRLLYNRYLQWRFANSRAEAVLYTQKVTAEKTLFNVWNATLSLCDSVIRKRINLQQLKQELKLNTVLNDQMVYLNDWTLLEKDHSNTISGAVEDLEASTLHIPVTGRAKVDVETLKVAMSSAVDVMLAMGSNICSLLSKVEGVNCLISELAVVAAREKAMLDECEALLASMTTMQVEEYSTKIHLIQQSKCSFKEATKISGRTTLPWP